MPDRLSWTRVCVDYSEDHAIAKAIDDCSFHFKLLGIKPDKIPLVGRGVVHRKVAELKLNRCLYSDELMKLLERKGCKAADPLTTLRYAADHADRSRSLITVFNRLEMEWSLYIRKCDDTRRLELRWEEHNALWPTDVSLLVVRR